MADGDNADTSKGKDKVKVDPKPDVIDKEAPQETMSIPIKDFVKLQQANVDLQTKADDAAKQADEVKKEYVMKELKTLNPKLAEANKDASFSTLEVVLETIKSMKGSKQFPNLPKEDNNKLKIEGSPGYRLMGTEEWIVKNT